MSEKMVPIVLSAELTNVMRSAVINRCGQLQDHLRNLRRWREMAEYVGHRATEEA